MLTKLKYLLYLLILHSCDCSIYLGCICIFISSWTLKFVLIFVQHGAWIIFFNSFQTTLRISWLHWSTATVLPARLLLFPIIKVWDASLCSTSKHMKVNVTRWMRRSRWSQVSLTHLPQPVASKPQLFPRLPVGLWAASPSTWVQLRPLTSWWMMRRAFKYCTARTTRRLGQLWVARIVVDLTSGVSCSATGSLLPASRWMAKCPRLPSIRGASVATMTTAWARRMAPFRSMLVHRGWWRPFFLL